jgi:hypothetical protein
MNGQQQQEDPKQKFEAIRAQHRQPEPTAGMNDQQRAQLKQAAAGLRQNGVSKSDGLGPSQLKHVGQETYTGNREHGKHVGNTIGPVEASVEQGAGTQEQGKASGETATASQKLTKEEVLEKARAIAQSAKEQQAQGQEASGTEKIALARQQIRRPPARGHER